MVVRFIWFDLGYTLAYINREEMYYERLQTIGISKSIEELMLAFHLADKYYMREHPGALGKKTEQVMNDYYKRLNEYLHIQCDDLTKERYILGSEIKPEWRPFEETISTLEKLKTSGIGVGLISNWDETAIDVLEKTKILPLLDKVIISSEIGIEKPDERIFLHALEQIDIPVCECLYVGDNYYDDVLGSRKVGMDSILINPFDNIGIEEIPDILKISNIKELFPALDLFTRERVKEEV
ncbi:HAD-IA family hydrolase [Psychrobacillus vulpis]|uniref:HAD-IA family hydrolase n=1 Tax=Psychrobacillus vulpis TaxID=2325572 RepID=A0A544TJG3_9BACI|nr:HAD-IA family hydrolase [Psychrobacillus vulpis]